ncbi:MAG: type I-F CRISPR-associated protein Csy1 [Psittacicella sp.]
MDLLSMNDSEVLSSFIKNINEQELENLHTFIEKIGGEDNANEKEIIKIQSMKEKIISRTNENFIEELYSFLGSGGLSGGTHTSKGIHTSSKGLNIFFKNSKQLPEGIIGSQTSYNFRHDLFIDVTGSSATGSKFYNFLNYQFQQNGKILSIKDLFIKENEDFIKSLAPNSETAKKYAKAITDTFLSDKSEINDPKIDDLNKQLLWPLNPYSCDSQDIEYKNLVPLYPSSFTYDINSRLKKHKNEMYDIKDRNKKDKTDEKDKLDIILSYLDTLIKIINGKFSDEHLNISYEEFESIIIESVKLIYNKEEEEESANKKIKSSTKKKNLSLSEKLDILSTVLSTYTDILFKEIQNTTQSSELIISDLKNILNLSKEKTYTNLTLPIINRHSYFTFPNLAVTTLGGSNSINAGVLINKFSGKMNLFPNFPPETDKKYHLSTNINTIFNPKKGSLLYRCNNIFKNIVENVIMRSDRNLRIRNIRDVYLNQLLVEINLYINLLKIEILDNPERKFEKLNAEEKYLLGITNDKSKSKEYREKIVNKIAIWIQDVIKQKYSKTESGNEDIKFLKDLIEKSIEGFK